MLKFHNFKQMKTSLENLHIYKELSDICRSDNPSDALVSSDLDICTSALGETLIYVPLERGRVYMSFQNILYLFFNQNANLVFGDIVNGEPIEKSEIYQDNRALIIDGKPQVFSYIYKKPCFTKNGTTSEIKVRLGQDQRIKLVDYMLLGMSTFDICKDMNLPKSFVDNARAAIISDSNLKECPTLDVDAPKFRLALMRGYSDSSIAQRFNITVETVNLLRQSLRYDTVSEAELTENPGECTSDLIAEIDPLLSSIYEYAGSLSLPEIESYDPLDLNSAEEAFINFCKESKKLHLSKQCGSLGIKPI